MEKIVAYPWTAYYIVLKTSKEESRVISDQAEAVGSSLFSYLVFSQENIPAVWLL
jgi:hypothetical protein